MGILLFKNKKSFLQSKKIIDKAKWGKNIPKKNRYETYILECAEGSQFDFTEWRELSRSQGVGGWELVNFQIVNSDNHIVAVFKKRDSSSFY